MKFILTGIWIILLFILAHLTPQFGEVGKFLTFTGVIFSAVLIIIGIIKK